MTAYYQEYVRCKSVIAMHHFSCRSPQHCHSYMNNVTALLSDKDPGVVAQVIHFLVDNQSCVQLGELAPALVDIQRQVLSSKLPREYSYHEVSAPWMQLSLIHLLGAAATTEALAVVQDTLTACYDISRPMVCAIACACATNLLARDCGKQALQLAVKLLGVDNHNLKLAGLLLLEHAATRLDKTLLSVLHEKDSVLLPTLHHRDPTLRNATMRLLCATCTQENARHISSCVLTNIDQPQSSSNKELVLMAVDLACKYPDNHSYWHLATMIRLLPVTDGDLTAKVQATIKEALTAVPVGETNHLVVARRKVLRVLHDYCTCKQVSTCHVQLYMWTLSHCSPPETAIPIITRIGRKVLSNSKQESGSGKLLVSIIDAALFILTQTNSNLDLPTENITALRDLAQDLHQSDVCIGYLLDATSELCNTLRHLSLVQNVPPTTEEEFDFTLSFLDDYVTSSLECGGKVYQLLSQSQSAIVSTDLAGSELGSRSSDDFDLLSSLDSWNPFSSQRSPVWTPTGRVEATDNCGTTHQVDQMFPSNEVDLAVDEFDQLVHNIAQGKSTF